MQVRRRLAPILVLMLMPALAWAHSCPLEIYKIDQALAKTKFLDTAVEKKVRQLRAEGEKLHRQDKHGEAMLVLGSAKKLLNIE